MEVARDGKMPIGELFSMLATHNSAVRAIDIAISFVDREEQRLRAIMESDTSSGEAKFQALQDLAYLSGVVVRELADFQSTSSGPDGATETAPGVVAKVEPAASQETMRPTRKSRSGGHPEVKAASFHQDVCDNLSEGVYFVDKQRKITYWNRGARKLSGFQRDEAVGRHCYDNFLKHVDAEGRALCHLGCPLAATLKDGQAREAEVFLHHKDGHKVPVAVRVSPVTDNSGKLIGAVEVFSNIAPQKELERRAKEFEELAYRDSLTGLSSRRHIELKLRQTLEEVQEFGRKAGVLLLDIDGFKRVNDMHGHPTGDAALKAVGERLTEVLRPGDAAGRWGGEEFLFVALDVNMLELEAIAERCRSAIALCRVPAEGEPINITASVGAVLLKKGDSAEAAVKRADELLYIAKCQGGNSARVRVEG
jgi:diguanylate cyclase (GGDEF)-like protein/PAS domain S-box-containing protein